MTKVEELVSLAQELPSPSLDELLNYARSLRPPPSAWVPVALGGLWQGVEITVEDVKQARQEMWSHFGDEKENGL